jgi:HlyD family secretion protein
LKRLWIPLAIVVIFAAVAGAGYFGYQSSKPTVAAIQTPPTIAVARGDVQHAISAPGQLVGVREALLSMTIGGRIARLNVRPGDKIRAGDVIARLDDTDLRYALQTAQANLTSAQSAYDAAVARNARSADQIVIAKAQLDKATVALKSAQSVYDRVAWRSDVGMLPESAALQQATIDYQAALANYNLTATTINDSAVKSAAQALVQAQVAVNQANDKLAATKLVAPFDAVVLDVKVIEGDTVNAGFGIVRVSDPKAAEARVTVVEEDYPQVRAGQSAEIFFDARPEILVTGKVSRIVPMRDAGTNPIYPIYLSLDDVPDGLAPGMTVDASILIAKKTNVLRLPRSLAKARADGTAVVKVWTGSNTEDRVIKVGLRGNQYVEILEGLREGELVVSR